MVMVDTNGGEVNLAQEHAYALSLPECALSSEPCPHEGKRNYSLLHHFYIKKCYDIISLVTKFITYVLTGEKNNHCLIGLAHL